jgi:protein SCO1/2
MAKLQSDLNGDDHVQLVSFTVDPQDDTPAVLSAYANNLGADPTRRRVCRGRREKNPSL